jgi:hypothetical protein
MLGVLETLGEFAAVGFAFGFGMFLAAELITVIKSLISAWIVTKVLRKR